MNQADQALIEAWELSLADHTDQVEDRFEELLPALVRAGYAETDDFTWRFTPKGVARADELLPEE
jgi:hypothetical protein